MGSLSSKPKRAPQSLHSPSSSFVSAYEVIDHPNYFSNTPTPSYHSRTGAGAMPQNSYQEHNRLATTTAENPQISQPRIQRWSTPVEPPSKNYSSPPHSRSRRHSTAEEICPTAKLGSNGAGPQFRDVDWGNTNTNTNTTTVNGKMLRDRVSEISKCASDVEKLVDGYLEEHSEMQKKLKAKIETGSSIATVQTRISRSTAKCPAVSTSCLSEIPASQVQVLKDRISELEKKIKYMERQQQKELSERERSTLVGIQKADASHKIEIESVQKQLADVSLKLQNHKTKVESLTDQKSHLIFEKDQLQAKLENQALETTNLRSKIQNQSHEIHDLQSRLKRTSQERDGAIEQCKTIQDEVNTVKNIIRNCKYCAGVWEFTQHRGSIDVNVWCCDIKQDGAGYTPPSSVETSLNHLKDLPDLPDTVFDNLERFFIKEFKTIIQDIEKLSNSIAFRLSYCDFYMKSIDINALSSFRHCLQNQTLDSEIFFPYFQYQIWHKILQPLSCPSRSSPHFPNTPPENEVTPDPVFQTLKLDSAEASEIRLDYKTLATLISAIRARYSALAIALNFFQSQLKISLTPLETRKFEATDTTNTGFDLFPIIRRTDNGLIIGQIPVKNIEENATIIPITPILYYSTLTPKILVRGTAIVYELKRSAPLPRPPSVKIPGSPAPKPHTSQNNPVSPDTPIQEEPNSPSALLRTSSFSKYQAFFPPPSPRPVLRPCLHRKPKLPPLDTTTSTTATPTNSPVLQRTTTVTSMTIMSSSNRPPPPQIPPKNLTLRRGSVQNSTSTGPGIRNVIRGTKDSEANPNKELPQSPSNNKKSIKRAPKSLKEIPSDDDFSSKWSHKSNPSHKNHAGTPLAAIWRKLEELDKKNGSGSTNNTS
ncbi:hypothetical protein TWF679_009711 [Orbilia oligospora]|uniref:Uncharacterized protein n=1 Tax=Orbilia oligospora TaxID=2813651 RepID=A0A8H8VJH8_ORBOL|nr:hypothetical protein TWF679_009711 [Orbilia oligospora]